jgi:hypothetical protein
LARHETAPTDANQPEQGASVPFAGPLDASLQECLASVLGDLSGSSDPAALTLKAIAVPGGEGAAVARSLLALDLTNAAIRLQLALGDPCRLNADWRHALRSGVLPEALSPHQSRLLQPAQATIRDHGPWLAHLLAKVGLTVNCGVGPQPVAPGSSESSHAGTALALRALIDVRVMHVLGAAHPRFITQPVSAKAWIAALLARWAGTEAWGDAERLDPGLALMAGLVTPPTRGDVVELIGPVANDALAALDAALVGTLVRQRGDGLPTEPTATDLAAVAGGGLGSVELDAWLARAACLLLGHWARWLRGFEPSSIGFLLDRFLRRPGRIVRTARSIEVVLPVSGLDVVLRLAGYLEPVSAVPWLDGLQLEFRTEHAP